MKMKLRLSTFFLMIGLVPMSILNCVQAQNSPPDTPAMTMLRDFYTNYLKEFTDLSSAHAQKLNTILKKYCTTSLINKVPKLAVQIDSDPFLKAQDSDSTWAKSLVIKKDLKKPSIYIVSYGDAGNASTIIHLFVIKQRESYKIADVW
jgi:hypothetical protein